MAIMDLEFIEDGHQYWHEGYQIPSVTQVIEAVYPTRIHYTEKVRQRGKAVHKAVEFYEKGTLDTATVDHRIEGYLRGYKKAKGDLGIDPNPQELEVKVFHPHYRVAGCIDIIDRPNRRIIDIKSGIPVPEVVLQQGGYKLTLEDDEIEERLVLYLKADGSYVPKWCRNPEDVRAFIHVLGCYYWGQANGKF